MQCVASLSASWLAQQGLSATGSNGSGSDGENTESMGNSADGASRPHGGVYATTVHAVMQTCVTQLRLACMCMQHPSAAPDAAPLLATSTAHALVALTHVAVCSHSQLAPEVLSVRSFWCHL
jgi:hypothetical protein